MPPCQSSADSFQASGCRSDFHNHKTHVRRFPQQNPELSDCLYICFRRTRTRQWCADSCPVSASPVFPGADMAGCRKHSAQSRSRCPESQDCRKTNNHKTHRHRLFAGCFPVSAFRSGRCILQTLCLQQSVHCPGASDLRSGFCIRERPSRRCSARFFQIESYCRPSTEKRSGRSA